MQCKLHNLPPDIIFSILELLSLKDVTTLYFTPEWRKAIRDCTIANPGHTVMTQVGVYLHLKLFENRIMEFYLEKLKSQTQRMNFVADFISHPCTRTLIPLLLIGSFAWPLRLLFGLGIQRDTNDQHLETSLHQASISMFNEFTQLCSSIGAPITFNKTCLIDGRNHEECCEQDEITSRCDYSDPLCLSIYHLMMNCSLSLWLNFTTNCDAYHSALNYDDGPASGAIVGGAWACIFLLIAMIAMWSVWPKRESFPSQNIIATDILNKPRNISTYLKLLENNFLCKHLFSTAPSGKMTLTNLYFAIEILEDKIKNNLLASISFKQLIAQPSLHNISLPSLANKPFSLFYSSSLLMREERKLMDENIKNVHNNQQARD